MRIPRFALGVVADFFLVLALVCLGWYMELSERWGKRLDELQA